MDFKKFQAAVARQYKKMEAHGHLFRTSVSADDLWETYLASYPAGSNPIYKERTEHDCNCCKQFVRAVGNVVALVNGKIESIWDCQVDGEPNYQVVADAMSKKVKASEVNDFFLHFEKTAGTAKTIQQIVDGVITWDHFFVSINPKFVSSIQEIPSKLSNLRSRAEVFQRALEEISSSSIEIVQDLIAQNSIYRGSEQKPTVDVLAAEKALYDDLDRSIKKIWAWTRSNVVFAGVAHVKNSSIGTLLLDIEKGLDLEDAVKKYEVVVAPANYKRSSSPVSKKMVEEAKKKIEELGWAPSMKRRYAVLTDISVNNVIFANRDAKKVIAQDVFEELSNSIGTKAPKNLDKIVEVSIEDFIKNVVPTASSLEVMMENTQVGNLVSLITAEDPTSASMFNWNNQFSWSYNGDFADSIKERVKNAGGNVTGEFCCRLAWDYEDDLDFYMEEPGGQKIFFGNRRIKSACGGMLDVDANGIDGIVENPVENIFYNKISTMKEGRYELKVHNYNRRSSGTGFSVEIDILGQVYNFDYEQVLSNNKKISIAEFEYTKKGGLKILTSMKSKKTSKQIWGIKTNDWTPVNVVMMSPNFWDGQGIGNKHYFFMLANCANEGQARGFYNEFLKPELHQHRKVMEMIGSRLKTETSDHQLSGLGFSSTQRNSLLCKVGGSFNRIVKIVF